jgi:hypothetical protein
MFVKVYTHYTLMFLRSRIMMIFFFFIIEIIEVKGKCKNKFNIIRFYIVQKKKTIIMISHIAVCFNNNI